MVENGTVDEKRAKYKMIPFDGQKTRDIKKLGVGTLEAKNAIKLRTDSFTHRHKQSKSFPLPVEFLFVSIGLKVLSKYRSPILNLLTEKKT